jgi:ABC-type transporter Mla subunit MlaD
MTAKDRIDRIETNIDKLTAANAGTQANLDRLVTVTATIAELIAAHDEQIVKLVAIVEIERQEWAELRREFQAYLTTIHPRQ